jgi:hypothetical protein
MKSFALVVAMILAFAGMATGCSKREPERPFTKAAPAPKPSGPPRLDDLFSPRITPTSDGGAYVTSELGGGVWYLRGSTATRVTEKSQP